MAVVKDARTGEALGQVYESTFRDHPSSMCVLRMHDLTFVAANPAFERASGRSLADLLGTFGLVLDTRSSLSELSNVTVAQIAPVIPYLLLVLILILRPTGLLGTRDT